MEECVHFADVSKVPENITKLLLKRIKILIVEDDIEILECLEGFFSTPYIHVETAINADEALLAISSSTMPWHCWIIDMNLGRLSGCAILEKHRQFPCAIIYSGIGDMELASKAKELGAAEVIDKKPNSISKLIIKTCKLIPISILCKGFLLKNINVFYLLKENIIKNHDEWARMANLSLRQLQNICDFHMEMSPTFVLSFYYGLQYLLIKSFNSFKLPIEYSLNQFFFRDCLNFIEQNLSYYKNFLK